MAKFQIGQRVRFVKNENPMLTVPIGTEGVIKGHDTVGWFPECPWEWEPDDTFLRAKYGKIRSPSDHLEPIINKPETTTWDKMGFHPNDFLKECAEA